ncbi:TIGR03862 family flavoprotein [Mangrovicoccus algicola]|uniref:TIGR03862 family flavoprotein n=1 Tax=Mangrovicoccus algicola TaxID=2771008 RepID=A0A8J6Z249_9RHOB|nr:TIGR03862 family flavoprotein [Mangrovicoccus algicola]MBE3640236.1 TIGR03862 family flavoprotein [Mangrovicoccus algicola]
MAQALVIGAGPAGLMAAELLSAAGQGVLVAEAMPTPARKFLMAGKSGLNITREQDAAAFLAAYGAQAGRLAPMIDAFGPAGIRAWMEALGQEAFTGSTGRVFPVAMKASPLLRAWLGRLAGAGVELRTRWRWTGWDGAAARFDTPEGPRQVTAGATVLALGGASWPRLGSDGTWQEILAAAGVPLDPILPSNVGLALGWSAHMARHLGAPVKNVALGAGRLRSRGEFVLSARGLEGAGIYAVIPAIREGAPLLLDLAPDLEEAEVARRLSAGPARESLSNRLRKRLALSPAKIALLREFGGPPPSAAPDLAARLKALRVPHDGPRPVAEAISTAGGIRLDALDDALMLQARPGTFAAGEMLSWDAPTGGYLLTACLATGRQAGLGAAAWLDRQGLLPGAETR